MTALLDTDVLIDLLHKREPTTQYLRELRDRGETLATSSVNAAELWRGASTPAARDAVMRLLTALHEVPFGPRMARRFGELMHALDRADSPIGNTDGLIAACALESGARLVTRNAKEYRRVPGLEVLVPRKE
ncbi:MAG TPA: type II toxin-antitoxin system VapC family toxin [Candidatus Thermoplasmatota archaeon]|nr:type II toxin-antitoxin system VapC family toxin [Candidatus Thermoplasmatota archaeon]